MSNSKRSSNSAYRIRDRETGADFVSEYYPEVTGDAGVDVTIVTCGHSADAATERRDEGGDSHE